MATKPTRRPRAALLLGALLLALLLAPLSACQRPARVTVVGGWRDSLAFRLSPGGAATSSLGVDTAALPGLASLTISQEGRYVTQGEDAGGAVVWQLLATDAVRESPAPRLVRYGEHLAGYVEDHPAPALGPGRYVVTAVGPGVRGNARFRVSPSGRIE